MAETFFQQDSIMVLYDCSIREGAEQFANDWIAWRGRAEKHHLIGHHVIIVIYPGVGIPA